MAHATRPAPRFATWLIEGADSPTDRAVSNPASLGYGADLVGFGGGQPAVETYPIEALERAYASAIREAGRQVLPYGATQGLPALRELICARLAPRGIRAEPENVAILTGSIQGLHLVGRITLDRGDTIITEAPTFMGALAAWEQQQPRYVSVPVDEHGLVVDHLREALRDDQTRVKFLYLLPTFQNPSGVSLTRERRHQLLEVVREHDLLVIEDDPYGEFWFDDGSEPIPPLRALPGSEDHVLYVGTFSKILAPGIRLAYIVGPRQIIDALLRAKRGVDFHTDTLLQEAVVRLLHDDAFDLEAHVQAGRELYRARRDAMLDSLEATFDSETKWTQPGGGFFLWMDLPHAVSGEAVATAGLQLGVSVLPGYLFYPNLDGGRNGLRMSFSNTPPERIREGVARLKQAVDTVRA
ncbi:MAG: PLP-dependent aminotransferase family protein [Chloroflexi bacterium]|nr:PLP-dependent aminotransferase family protein [Chloroflexota bacterium]MBV9134855.1 PLP-dependent aminotransferase family protein [Chloroflexota bacterium]